MIEDLPVAERGSSTGKSNPSYPLVMNSRSRHRSSYNLATLRMAWTQM
jgi:hypothetical protein